MPNVDDIMAGRFAVRQSKTISRGILNAAAAVVQK
jgi:hypothetical protein